MADKPTKKPLLFSSKDEAERHELLQAIGELEHENKSLRGQLVSASAEVVAELKAKNKELKTTLLQVEKDLAIEMLNRKQPIDALALSDKLQIFKTCVMEYCVDRNLDPYLWKKLESL